MGDVHHTAARRRAVVRDAVGISVAVGAVGASFGALAVASGLSVAQTCVMSLLVFAGASQFAAVGIVAAGGTEISAVASGVLLNTRELPFGMAVGRLLGDGRARRAVGSQLVIDESTALALAQPDAGLGRLAFWGAGIAVYVTWNLATWAGALAGSGLDVEAAGLDAAFPAAFVALVMPALRTPNGRRAALAGAVIALVLVPAAPAGVPIMAAAAGAVAGLPRHGGTAAGDRES
ncbi:MAG TPA: AzlC family ABC transporter permease [Acidimicrobiia bacterium]|nr:AzlC family ABC transporter permease [Acidimicrobiia bacterium]